MSNDESIVILGTSPIDSLETDGIKGTASGSSVNSLQKDTPHGSCFTSLKNSQIKDLERARETMNKTYTLKSMENSKDENAMIKSTKSTVSEGNTTSMGTSAESLLWPKTKIMPQTESETAATTNLKSVDANNHFIPLNLKDCAADSLLTQASTTSTTLKTSNISLKEHCKAENQRSPMDTIINSQNSKGSSGAQQNSLAANFIMGQVNADVLKSRVYSQFPSISMQPCAEDVKLQNMVTEYMQLKTTLEKVNNTMKLFYENSLQWKDKMNHMEVFYKQKLDDCEKQIIDWKDKMNHMEVSYKQKLDDCEKEIMDWKDKMNHMEVYYKQKLDDCEKQIMDLRDENSRLKKSIDEQIEQTKAVDVARQTDREEMIKIISEKTALSTNKPAKTPAKRNMKIMAFKISN